MINQKGTTLFEYLIAVIIIIAVGLQSFNPGDQRLVSHLLLMGP